MWSVSLAPLPFCSTTLTAWLLSQGDLRVAEWLLQLRSSYPPSWHEEGGERMSLPEESVPFKEVSWKTRTMTSSNISWGILTVREAGKCSFLAGHIAILNNIRILLVKKYLMTAKLVEYLFDAGSEHTTYITEHP